MSVRAQIPPEVTFVVDKMAAIANSADRQEVTLAGGGRIHARLVVLANGLNSAMRRNLGMENASDEAVFAEIRKRKDLF